MTAELGAKLRYIGSLSALYAITLGLVFVVARPVQRPEVLAAVQPSAPPQTEPLVVQAERQIITGKPVHLKISKLNLELDVQEGVYNPADGSWTLNSSNAFLALPSMPPNDASGTTVLYGHNNRHVFGRVWRLPVGEQVELYTDNGYVFTYRLESLSNIKPEDVSIFTNTGPPQLIIQTCTGDWNELRRVYRFTLEGVRT